MSAEAKRIGRGPIGWLGHMADAAEAIPGTLQPAAPARTAARPSP